MNTDTFEGQWKQMRGELRSWWGKLTDDDLEKIAGRRDRLVGVLQEKYGYTRAAAQQEVDRHFREYEQKKTASGVGGSGKTGQSIGDAAQNLGARLEEVADEAGGAAKETASSVGQTIGSLADSIREKAPHDGPMGTAATTVAEKLGAAGSYLQEKNWDNIAHDLSDIIRRHPIPSLLIGLGIGYLLAQRSRR